MEFVNKEDTVKHAGTNTEPVIIYVTADPSIWVKVNYEFEAVEGSGIPEAVIETLPTLIPLPSSIQKASKFRI